MNTGRVGDRGRFASMVGGLLLGAAGLALAVAGTGSPSAAEDRTCDEPPSARVADPDGPSSHSLTPAEAAELDQQLQEAAPERVPHAFREAVIPVVVHVISADDGTGNHSDARVREQVAVLDRAFGGGYGGYDTGFSFRLRETTRTSNDAWFHEFSAHEKRIKRELRQGGPGVLNIYSTDLEHGVLGHSNFPQEYAANPVGDGIVVDYQTLPGGGWEDFDLGHTATHETGHWLGLFHTFQNGCSSPGDYVADTPYEREEAHGCPVGRDTCRHRPGKDPVANFMNYSDDACMTEFTEGQADRMWRTWWAFRR